MITNVQRMKRPNNISITHLSTMYNRQPSDPNNIKVDTSLTLRNIPSGTVSTIQLILPVYIWNKVSGNGLRVLCLGAGLWLRCFSLESCSWGGGGGGETGRPTMSAQSWQPRRERMHWSPWGNYNVRGANTELRQQQSLCLRGLLIAGL